MKTFRKTTRAIALALTIAVMTSVMALALCSCGSKTLMTFKADNGKTYTVTASEMNFLMVFTKQNLFIGWGLYSAYDTASAVWGSTYGSTEQTYDKYYTAYVQSQLKSILVEKYLFDKYDLTLNKETLDGYKKEIATAKANQGGAGSYKQYYGYTTTEYYNYQVAVEKSKAIIEYLYGENGIDPVTDTEKETYYTENYVGYQYIMLNMKTKVKVDEDGNKVLKTEKDDDGNVTDTDVYDTEDLTDEESEEKQLLPAKLLAQIKEGADFGTLAAEYSDDYYSAKYPKGVFVLSTQQFINNEKTASDTIAALKVGEYTEALTVGDGEYTYIVKRVDLIDKVYDSEDYADLFSEYGDTVKYNKYDGVVEVYSDTVTEDATALEKYTMEKTFLSKYVDYYYQISKYSSSTT